MHEMALAEAVVLTALETAEKRGLERIGLLDVRVGELQRIRPGTLELCLQSVLPEGESPLSSAEIRVELERARFRFRPCGDSFGLAETGEAETEAIHFVPELARAFMGCPACGSPDFEVLAGRGVSIAALEAAG